MLNEPPELSADRIDNLPVQRTRLIGRERDVAAVRTLILEDPGGLVTLTGPPGTGKTSLALAVAAGLRGHFPDGVIFVNFATISDPALVLPTIAHALGIKAWSNTDLAETMANAMRTRTFLLVADNFEHVLPAASHLARLLTSCPDLRILATSRSSLRLRGEREYPVAPLGVPDLRKPVTVAELGRVPAVALFIERARAVSPAFEMTAENAVAVAAICVQLDGLPLAIELAAAKTKLLSPRLLQVWLEQRLPALAGGARDLPARQQTLGGAIAWSYDLLSPGEQAYFRRLAVFVGGWSIEAATVLGEGEVLDALSTLVDQSLVRREEGPDGDVRFSMLETIRQFGFGRLTENGEEVTVRQAHAAYFRDFARKTAVLLEGTETEYWLRLLEADHDNLRAALSWYSEPGQRETALRFATTLGWFWNRRNHWLEGVEWLTRLLAPPAAVNGLHRARALMVAAMLNEGRGRATIARTWLEEAIPLARGAGDHRTIARCLNQLGRVVAQLGDVELAVHYLEESLSLAREIDDQLAVFVSLWSLGDALLARGGLDEAGACYDAGVALAEDKSASGLTTNRALIGLGLVAIARGETARASLFLEQALAQIAARGEPTDDVWALSTRGLLALMRGDAGLAVSSYRAELRIWSTQGESAWFFDALEGLAGTAVLVGDRHRSARLFGAGAALRARFDVPHFARYRPFYDTSVSALRAALGDKSFSADWDIGAAMSVDDAVAEALRVSPSRTHASLPSNLSRRELEVLRLVAVGKSNREIAEALVISINTVLRHISNIFEKIGVSNRHEAAHFAMRNSLDTVRSPGEPAEQTHRE